MTSIRKWLGVCGVLLAAVMVLAPGGAQAATVLGQTTGTVFAETCMAATNPYTEVQVSTGDAPSYTVPAGGGVITSWSHQGGASETGDLKLKVYRPTMMASQYTVVGSSQQTMVANTLTTTSTSIPVQAGDTLGYTRLVGSVMRCLFSTASAGDVVDDAPSVDTADGDTTTFSFPGTNLRINISAVLEPDNDSDGLGDETQDMDDDDDTVLDVNDNCPLAANLNQANNDMDAQGDVCDPDDDNDGVADVSDSCPTVAGTGANGCAPAATPLIPNVTPTPASSTPKKKCKKRKRKTGAAASKKCRRKR